MENENLKSILIIIDDIFPTRMSSFRNVEYDKYISQYQNILIINISKIEISPDITPKIVGKNIYYFQTNFDDNQVYEIKKILTKYNNKIATIDFLNNISAVEWKVLNFLEENNIKFMLTLYPGGGFFFDETSKKKLLKVFSSKMFYKVIITQKKILEYILENQLCKEEQIKFIYGLPVSHNLLNIDLSKKRYYGIKGKINFNICFVAYKYSPQGKDKGYDVFIKIAKILRKKYNDIYFHVVGNFNENDIDVMELDERIAFYGVQKTEWFEDFYKDKDLIISPTKPNILNKGSFDGFPTGATTEAMLNGVTAIVSDPLNMNFTYQNNKDIIIIKNEQEILKTVEFLKSNPKKMVSISKKGYKKCNKIYCEKYQLEERLKILKEMESLK